MEIPRRNRFDSISISGSSFLARRSTCVQVLLENAPLVFSPPLEIIPGSPLPRAPISSLLLHGDRSSAYYLQICIWEPSPPHGDQPIFFSAVSRSKPSSPYARRSSGWYERAGIGAVFSSRTEINLLQADLGRASGRLLPTHGDKPSFDQEGILFLGLLLPRTEIIPGTKTSQIDHAGSSLHAWRSFCLPFPLHSGYTPSGADSSPS